MRAIKFLQYWSQEVDDDSMTGNFVMSIHPDQWRKLVECLEIKEAKLNLEL